MNSPILRTASGFLISLLLLGAVFLLIRGHNEPGGGFIAGLVAASAFALHGLAYSPAESLRLLKVRPPVLMSLGVLTGIGSGIPGLIIDGAFMSGQWISIDLGAVDPLKVGTPLLFDLGVFLSVTGVAVTLTLSFLEE